MATPTETELAQVWERLLQKDALGPDDDFFLAGGDSLAAMQLVLAANERFNVELSIDLVFSDANTIRKMAAVIDERKRWPKTGRNPDLPVHAIDERIVRPSIGERSDTATRRQSNAAPTLTCRTCSSATSLRACVGCDRGPGSVACRPTRKDIVAPKSLWRSRRERSGSRSWATRLRSARGAGATTRPGRTMCSRPCAPPVWPRTRFPLSQLLHG